MIHQVREAHDLLARLVGRALQRFEQVMGEDAERVVGAHPRLLVAAG